MAIPRLRSGQVRSQTFTRHNLSNTLVTDTYSYTYDNINRLTQGSMLSNKGRETLTYDKMGNIKTLTRTGNNSTVVDLLTYNYTGNRLTSVVDGTPILHLVDEPYQLTGTTSYTYDANGNVKTRVNAAHTANNISSITYNFLNLPRSVTAVSGNVTYVYDGNGRKLRSINGIQNQTRDYVDGIEYTGGTMELIHTEEGRITRSGNTYTYHYFLRDHLGNNRVGFAQGTNVTVPNFTADYYPFGLQHQQYVRPGSPKNNYLYNGKELQDGLKQYDYGARFYDPVIGRWGVIDPLAEERNWLSPYNYVQNNPMVRIDPTGALDWVINEEDEIYWDKNATSQATTKAGETYLGRDLTFTFNSYIDGNLWDGPLGSFPAGDKLTSTVNVTSNTDADNNLLSVDIKSSTFVHKTGGIFQGDSYYPGQKNVALDIKGATSGSATFEQHAKVNGFEEMGLGIMGYDKVNVAQKLTLGLNGNNLSVTGSTDIFPSATLSVNGTQLFKYNQPSFKGTHGYKRETVFGDNGMGGSTVIQSTPLRPAPAFYQRYKR